MAAVEVLQFSQTKFSSATVPSSITSPTAMDRWKTWNRSRAYFFRPAK
jgi:hypothetical protein